MLLTLDLSWALWQSLPHGATCYLWKLHAINGQCRLPNISDNLSPCGALETAVEFVWLLGMFFPCRPFGAPDETMQCDVLAPSCEAVVFPTFLLGI